MALYQINKFGMLPEVKIYIYMFDRYENKMLIRELHIASHSMSENIFIVTV